MSDIQPYDRQAAVDYAHRWAYGRNPAFYDFQNLGGDCTSFASQCLYAGCGIMNFTPVYGWYYLSVNDRSPSWAGVVYFYRFLVRAEENSGPFAAEVALSDCLPGDFVQLSFDGVAFGHTPVIVEMGTPPTPENTLVAAHSNDADYRPLSTYDFRQARYLHILGARP
ncbi:MAG: amidase domain-containing protein [Clostridiales bacterium]|nr:amidase domain-containing protein [Clostridiales bacterium]